VGILRDVDLEAHEGQSLAIVGPSGSGKTSLLMVTAGLERATSGKVEVAGRSARAKKDKATPKQKRDAAEHHRTGPVTFVQQSVAELRKVVYPTGPQLANYFVVVLIFVLFIIAYVSLLDLGIGAAVFRIFA
jgi:preprotein translocase subunit SecE